MKCAVPRLPTSVKAQAFSNSVDGLPETNAIWQKLTANKKSGSGTMPLIIAAKLPSLKSIQASNLNNKK
jgi:hypothetical protein